MAAAVWGDSLGDLLGLGPASAAAERQRLYTQRATVSRLIDDVARGRTLIPPDGGRFWHSDAQRAYAARLRQLRSGLALGQLSLEDARGSIDRALERLALAVAEAGVQGDGRG